MILSFVVVETHAFLDQRAENFIENMAFEAVGVLSEFVLKGGSPLK